MLNPCKYLLLLCVKYCWEGEQAIIVTARDGDINQSEVTCFGNHHSGIISCLKKIGQTSCLQFNRLEDQILV